MRLQVRGYASASYILLLNLARSYIFCVVFRITIYINASVVDCYRHKFVIHNGSNLWLTKTWQVLSANFNKTKTFYMSNFNNILQKQMKIVYDQKW